MKPVSVHDYLWNTAKYPPKPVCVVYGDDAFLRANAVRHIRDQVLAGEDAEFSLTLFEGDDSKLEFREVLQELRTVAMFGGSRRVVRVDEADSFVTKNRTKLEEYAAKPSDLSVLILQLKTFPSTTKLYKQLAETGLLIEVNEHSERDMPQWVVQWSKHHHKTPCDLTAAKMIVDRIGLEYGLLDQELAKLALMVTDKKGITSELVERAVGSWRTRKIYEMLDLALAGNTAAAIRQLDALMAAAADPKKSALGILSYSLLVLRKFVVATELILEAERNQVKLSVRSALEKAGESRYVEKAEKQLLHLGRHRGAKLPHWLLQLERNLTGESRSDPRVLLETFIVKLSSPMLRETASH